RRDRRPGTRRSTLVLDQEDQEFRRIGTETPACRHPGNDPVASSAICPLTTLTAKICCDAQHAPLPNVIALAAPEPRQDGKLMRQREFIALFGSTALAEPRVHAGFRR